MINAGELDREIVIKAPNHSVGSYGAEEKAWTTHATVWAKYTPKNGTETNISNTQHSNVAADFLIRYLSTLTKKMQIEFEGLTYRITSITEIGRKVGQIIGVETVL